VAIKPKTRERLMGIGRKGETYDYIINKLINEYENNGKKKTMGWLDEKEK